jgi:hypothetical protein
MKMFERAYEGTEFGLSATSNHAKQLGMMGYRI